MKPRHRTQVHDTRSPDDATTRPRLHEALPAACRHRTGRGDGTRAPGQPRPRRGIEEETLGIDRD